MTLPRRALYLKDSADIASGEKSAFAVPEPKHLEGRRALLVKTENGGCIPGIVTVKPAKAISVKAFDDLKHDHGIEPKLREKWWPEQETLYLHYVEFEPLETSVTLDKFPANITTDADLLGVVPVTVKAIVLSREETNDGYTYTYGLIGD